MAEVTNELIYAVMRKLQEIMSATWHNMREIKTGLRLARVNAVSKQHVLMNIYSSLGRHEVRLDSIERRLKMREPEPA